MIIRKEVQLTLKASPLNIRRSERLRVGELAREYDLRIVEKGEKRRVCPNSGDGRGAREHGRPL
jgi:hypothetical protein